MLRLAAAVAAAVTVLGLSSQDPGADPRVLHRAHQLSVPGEQHALLAALAGEWDVLVRTTAPGKDTHEGRGRLVASPILGGRYAVLNFVLELQGTKVEAVQILGFDTLRKLWTSSWRDELATWAVEASGPVTPDQPALLKMTGSLADARDPTGRPFRLQLDLRDTQRVAVRLSDSVDGKEVEVQTQEWTKR